MGKRTVKDFRQSIAFARYLEAGGFLTDKLSDGTNIFIYKLPYIGLVIRIPRPYKIDLKLVDKECFKYKPVFIKIEPDARYDSKILEDEFSKNGYKKDNFSIEPEKTLVINLKRGEKTLFLNLKPKWRQYIRKAQKNGVRILPSDDIDQFIKLWQKNAMRKNYLIESPKQTKIFWQGLKKDRKVKILTAFVENQDVGGSFLVFENNRCSLWHLAYSGEGTDLKVLYLLVWQSILLAKKSGALEFDFEGERHASFFKKGFGAVEKKYIGSFIKFTNPLLAMLYILVRNLNPHIFRLFLKERAKKELI